MKLYPFQADCIKAVQEQFRLGRRRVLVEIAPGGGKSVVCAEMCLKASRNGKRVLVLCHQREILVQNREALKTLSSQSTTETTDTKEVLASIYCDGLGSKSTEGQVVFASRDSFALADIKDKFELIIVDEAHLISSRELSRYQTIFKRNGFGHSTIIGLTATPYRLQGGLLYGKNKPFEVCAFHLRIDDLVKLGFLVPYSIKEVPLVMEDESATAVVSESVKLILEHMKDRVCTIIFCESRAHAARIAEQLPGCEYLDGETSLTERDTLISDMRAGKVKFVANVNVLSTGVDVKCVDGVVFLRPTMSASLWVQGIGRALRTFPEGGKQDAKILELTNNMDKFGDLSKPMYTFGAASEQELTGISLGGEAAKKKCPECESLVPVASKVCPSCNELLIRRTSDLQDGERINLPIQAMKGPYQGFTPSKRIPCMIVELQTPLGTIRDWLMTDHKHPMTAQIARAKLRRLRQHNDPPSMVRVVRKGKYLNVSSYH